MSVPFLTPQIFRVDFGQGLDTKTDPKALSSGKMVTIDNARFQNNNRVSKRYGFTAVGFGNASQIQRIDSFQGNVIGWGDPTGKSRSLYQYNQNITTAGFTPVLPAFNDCQVYSNAVIANNGAQNQADSATVNGFTLYAWIDTINLSGVGSGITYKVVNATTGQTVLAEFQLLSTPNIATNVKCIASGNSLLLGYVNATSSFISVYSFDTANNFALTSNNYSSFSLTNSNGWDWSAHTTATTSLVFMAFQQSATVIKFVKMSSNGAAIGAVGTFTASATVSTLGVVQPCPGTTSVLSRILWNDTNNRYNILPVTLSSLAAGTNTKSNTLSAVTVTVITGQELSDLASTASFFNTQVTTTVPQTLQAISYWGINSSGTFSNGGAISSLALHSKPIYINDNSIYMWGVHPSEAQGQYQLIHYMTFVNGLYNVDIEYDNIMVPAARTLVGNAMGVGQGKGTTSTVNMSYLGGNKYQCSCIVIGNQYTDNTGLIQTGALNNLLADFNYTNAFKTATLNGQQVICGGFNGLNDGYGVTELGYLIYPEGATAAVTTTSGHLGIGTYQYLFTYEWFDNNGNLHRSTPGGTFLTNTVGTGGALTITTSTTTSAATLTIPTLRTTLKQATSNSRKDVNIVIYRDLVNASPPIFQRVGSVPNQINSLVQSVTFTDTFADSVISAAQPLYTDGGVESNYTVDGCNCIVSNGQQLFTNDNTNNGIVHVGKLFNPTDGLAFFSDVTIELPIDDGPVTALQYMDTNLIIFKQRSIYVVSGQGPTDNGQNNGFSQPQLITNEVGCDGPHCVATYPDGLIFKSAKGYWRLGHDLSFAAETNYLSAPESANGYTCQRIVVRKDLNEVRILITDNASFSSILTYNYYFKQWSNTRTVPNDILNVDGNFYVAVDSATAPSAVCVESTSTFTDASAISGSNVSGTYSLFMQTGYFALNSLQGAQRIYRVRLLGDFKSTHTLSVNIDYDYQNTFAETHTISSSNITFNGSAYQCEFFPLLQECESIAFQITDTNPTGESFDLTDMEFEVGMEPGALKNLVSQKAF